MTDRSKIAAKIAALRAKTSAAGCTEAEVLAAAELAARLMVEHGLSEAEIEMVSASAEEATKRATWRTAVATTVAHVTNTAAIFHPQNGAVEFLGRDPGPEVAAYLYAVVVNAIVRASRDFKATAEYRRRRTTKTRRAALIDFANGMGQRLRSRLFEMFRPTLSTAARDAAWAALALRYPNARDRKTPEQKIRFEGAANAGYRSGADVTLAHGVAGAGGRPLAIGRA